MHACMISCFSHVQFFATPWTVAFQAPLSMGFSRQEYWSGLPGPPPGGLPDPGMEPTSLMSPALAGGFCTTSATGSALTILHWWRWMVESWRGRISFLSRTSFGREETMATHSSNLAWGIPQMEEPGRLQSVGSWRVRHDWATSLSLFTFMHWRRKWQPTPYSCLENPRDRGAWWAAVYGVTQSQTWLTLLSSSSSFGRPGGSPRTSHSLELFLVGCGVRASVFHSLLGANKFRPSIWGHCFPSDFTPLLSRHAPKPNHKRQIIGRRDETLCIYLEQSGGPSTMISSISVILTQFPLVASFSYLTWLWGKQGHLYVFFYLSQLCFQDASCTMIFNLINRLMSHFYFILSCLAFILSIKSQCRK